MVTTSKSLYSDVQSPCEVAQVERLWMLFIRSPIRISARTPTS